jgi:imidazoleglycerol phosphate synthase glutamine amidotransferase subunit HisH
VAGRTIYGDDNFVSVVRSGLVTGVQFHPERSAGDGLALLGNFVRACGDLRHVA